MLAITDDTIPERGIRLQEKEKVNMTKKLLAGVVSMREDNVVIIAIVCPIGESPGEGGIRLSACLPAATTAAGPFIATS